MENQMIALRLHGQEKNIRYYLPPFLGLQNGHQYWPLSVKKEVERESAKQLSSAPLINSTKALHGTVYQQGLHGT